MKGYFHHFAGLISFFLIGMAVYGQTSQLDSAVYYTQVRTYVNPVLPGDHPDPTMLKVGDDFYHCGSTFHFTPYLPVYHSKDMVHWEIISRVLPPTKAGWVRDKPSAGIWQGAITYFYGAYRIYFSSGGQWFCKADSPYGPWSEPERVKTNPVTGDLGYDNSIFVDDGKPYMVIKNMQKVNRLQALGKDGQLTDTVINLDWINGNLQYSWAEGPVMCKRNGYYYYFPAGDVSGGQYVLRTRSLTSDSSQWERLGEFFRPVTDPVTGFRRPNHISAPLQLADGSWWTIGQSYEKPQNDDWSGMGRQTSLYPVIWEGDRPWGMAPTRRPVEIPDLPTGNIPWRSVHADYFDKDSLGLWWHFLNRTAAGEYSLTARKGWIRLTPGKDTAHLLQKETDHFYTVVTRVDLDAADSKDKAGIYLTNGNQKVVAQLYTGIDQEKKIFFQSDTAVRSIPNHFGKYIWLKLVRDDHALTGYCSGDGNTWTSLGPPISAAGLDKTQPDYNSWVGTSIGLFAEGAPADFDLFICKDGFSPLPAAGYSNYYGVEKVRTQDDEAVTNTTAYGGWFMISGVSLGKDNYLPAKVSILASSVKGGNMELWLDDLSTGRKIATIPVPPTGGMGNWTICSAALKGIYGSHDLFVRFPPGSDHDIYIRQILFTKDLRAQNPIIFADVPDMSMIRVGDTWYMSSTTMHMSPGVPIMSSKDMVNWQLVSYAYDTLADVDELNLRNGKSTYGKGSWASSLRYHDSTFYVSTFSGTTGKTYIYFTKDPGKSSWKRMVFNRQLHDHSLFFDDDGLIYMIYGGGKLRLVRLKQDLSDIDSSIPEQVIIENASTPAGAAVGLPAEGSQLFKVNGKYYLFNIAWPRGGMRTVIVHRADRITGPYEGRVVLQDRGIAQGGIVNTPEGKWYAYLFRDYGAVGRIPYLCPLKWEDGWPVPGNNGKVPDTLDLPASNGLIPGMAASDEFSRRKGEASLPLVWQWDHNPDNTHWSVTQRKGYLRLTTGRIDTSFLLARNTLTQRTIGPVCTGMTAIDVSHLKEGDMAGLALLQKNYGLVGVRAGRHGRSIVMIDAGSGTPVESQPVPLQQRTVYFKASCDFNNRTDTAAFFYSLDGHRWTPIGTKLKMTYTLPHFMGYRFALFNYATKDPGGYADFDFFHITDRQ